MAQEQINAEIMETIRWGIGLILTGLAGVGVYIWRLATKLTTHGNDIKNNKKLHDKDIEDIKNDIEEMKEVQKQHAIRHDEVIKRIDESSKYLADELHKSSAKLQDYFDKKYQILEDRIYELKKWQ